MTILIVSISPDHIANKYLVLKKIGIVFKVLLNKFCCVSLVIHSATSVYLGLKTFCQYNDFQTEMHKTVSGR
jgi:hypothetical protein